MDHTPASDIMLPGTYLRLRRATAGFGLRDLARQLVALPIARTGPAEIFINRMAARLHDAETGAEHLLPAQAELLAALLPFEPQIYERLIVLGETPGLSLPAPQLCRACGCSWHMACVDRLGTPCSWCLDDSTLCTRCARMGQHEGGRTGQSLRFSHGPIPPRARSTSYSAAASSHRAHA